MHIFKINSHVGVSSQKVEDQMFNLKFIHRVDVDPQSWSHCCEKLLTRTASWNELSFWLFISLFLMPLTCPPIKPSQRHRFNKKLLFTKLKFYILSTSVFPNHGLRTQEAILRQWNEENTSALAGVCQNNEYFISPSSIGLSKKVW